jgi:Protein of unknown function (DUF2786)
MPDDLLSKITALLAKAETTTPGEAELIMQKVDELMAKYTISQAALDAARVARGDKITGFTEAELVCEGSYQHVIMHLMSAVAQAMGLRCCYSSYGSKIYFTVAGRDAEIDRYKVLIASLQIQGTRARKAFINRCVLNAGTPLSPQIKYKRGRSFLYGFGEGAAKKIRESREALIKEQPAQVQETIHTGLELSKTELDRWFEAKHSLKKGRGQGVGQGYSEGVAAGKQADVGQAKLHGGNKELNG